MPSAGTRRAQASRKAKKPTNSVAAPEHSTSDCSSQPVIATEKLYVPSSRVHTYINAKGKTITIEEAPLPLTWPYQAVHADEEEGDKSSLAYDNRRKQIFQSLAHAFEWDGEPIDQNSLYNAADPKSPFHGEWLTYQKTVAAPKTYTPSFVPVNLQDVKAKDIDLSSSEGSERPGSVPKHCRFWALGTCRNGEQCAFFHDPDTARKPNPRVPNTCWFWKRGRCSKGADACPYEHSE